MSHRISLISTHLEPSPTTLIPTSHQRTVLASSAAASTSSSKTQIQSSLKPPLMKSPITTHVLDTTNGVAASGIPVSLEILGPDGDLWTTLGKGYVYLHHSTHNTFFAKKIPTLNIRTTDKDGRIITLLSHTHILPPNTTYRLTFITKPYFELKSQPCFFPIAQIVFEVPLVPQSHYHVPLLLSCFSYSTYRGT